MVLQNVLFAREDGRAGRPVHRDGRWLLRIAAGGATCHEALLLLQPRTWQLSTVTVDGLVVLVLLGSRGSSMEQAGGFTVNVGGRAARMHMPASRCASSCGHQRSCVCSGCPRPSGRHVGPAGKHVQGDAGSALLNNCYQRK